MRAMFLCCLWVAVGCSTEEKGSGATPQPSASVDQVETDAASPVDTGRNPVSVYEPDLPEAGQFCAFLAAVECDGSEDCPQGQVCCGTLNGGSLSYDSVKCQDSCERANGGRVICHENDTCPDPENSCIRNIILPSYLGICDVAGAFTPTGFDSASTAAGEINCGSGLACTGGQVCCSLTSWDAETGAAKFIDGRCADSPDDCSCSAGTAPEPVSSMDSGAATEGGI